MSAPGDFLLVLLGVGQDGIEARQPVANALSIDSTANQLLGFEGWNAWNIPSRKLAMALASK